MGCFAYVCSVSGLPIEYRTPVRFLALAEGRRYQSGISEDWCPATLPIKARYNDYGTVERLARGPVTQAFFDSLAWRAIERPVGENPCHDVAITKTMSRREWLTALWEDRVQIEGPDGAIVEVRQTMIREDVWGFLVAASEARVARCSASDIRNGFTYSGLLPRRLLQDSNFEAPCRELFGVHNTLSALGRPWARGGRWGPQFGEWELHKDFGRLIEVLATRAIETHAANCAEDEAE